MISKTFNLILTIIVFCGVFGIETPALAQGNVDLKVVTYTLLAPLPFVVSPGSASSTTPFHYIPGLLQLVIAVAGVLAVLRIIYGGFQYITADGFGQKSSARETIQNSLLGLLLAIGSYAILFTLNAKLVNLDLSIESFPVAPALDNNLGSSTSPIPNGRIWPDDSAERRELEAAGITFNNLNCVTEGQTDPCTSVYGISRRVIDGLINLKRLCNCSIEITGGTEYWFHSAGTAHRPGGSVVDLSLLRGSLSAWLRDRNNNNSRAETGGGCAPGFERYRVNGALYVNENPTATPHWHVCF